MIKKFEEFVNEQLNIQNLDGVLNMNPQEQENLLRQYVKKYYNKFPDDFKNAKEDGSATLNWGEFETGTDMDIVANCVCDIISTHEMDERPMSTQEQALVDLAWKVADDYVNGR